MQFNTRGDTREKLWCDFFKLNINLTIAKLILGIYVK